MVNTNLTVPGIDAGSLSYLGPVEQYMLPCKGNPGREAAKDVTAAPVCGSCAGSHCSSLRRAHMLRAAVRQEKQHITETANGR